MGTDSQPIDVCYIMQDGEPIARFKVGNIGEMEIVLDSECKSAGALVAGAFGPLAFAMSIKMPKEWRCASRKRFTKLLMSYGCSRNDANELATIVQAPVGPQSYQELFFAAIALYADYATRKDEKLETA